MKAGRNDPCPCGSGEKYKKCCLLKNVTPPEELHYRRLSDIHDRLFEKLVPYAQQVFGEKALGAALDEFLLWPKPGQFIGKDRTDRQMPLFWPWFIFNWECDPLDEDFECLGPPEHTVAELYAQDKGIRLDPLERTLIQAVNRKPYSFYEIVDLEPGRWILLNDILSKEEIKVQEHSGSQYVKKTDILFGRAVMVDGVGMIIGLSPSIIPAGYKPEIIKLRQERKRGASVLTMEDLYEWDFEIRKVYMEMDFALHSPPQMCNTDGDPLEFHKIIYEIPSADLAFEKLASLCVTETALELRQQAELYPEDRIMRSEIPWNRLGHKASKGFPNTLLGNMVLEGRRLTIEVNSGPRAAKIRREVENRLGSSARFKIDEIRSLDAVMDGRKGKSSTFEKEQDHKELMQHPEVRRQVAEMIRRHWEGWVDTKIPALGNKTPREAIKTPDGQEAVEALLADAERGRGDDVELLTMNRAGARRVREIIGMGNPDY
jgi:hypothetical protein